MVQGRNKFKVRYVVRALGTTLATLQGQQPWPRALLAGGLNVRPEALTNAVWECKMAAEERAEWVLLPFLLAPC